MALLITRRSQAEQALCPKGWKWLEIDGEKKTPTIKAVRQPVYSRDGSYHEAMQNTWFWGSLTLDRKLTLEMKADAYRALVEMVLGTFVYVRVSSWNTTGNVRYPVTVQVMPLPVERLKELARALNTTYDPERMYEQHLKREVAEWLNVYGWTMADGYHVKAGDTLRDGKALCCSRCHRVYSELVTNPSDADEHFCRRCIRVCPGNDAPCSTPIFDNNFVGCEVHFPRATCPGCKRVCEIARGMGEHKGTMFCGDCLARICQRCDGVGKADPAYTIRDGMERYVVCKECSGPVKEWLNQDGNEKLVMERVPTMLVPSKSNRPVRLCSIELEVTKGAGKILQDLYTKGLTANNECLRHWSNAPDFCYMERDGSLPEFPAGGEVIFSKLRLDDETTAQKLAEAVGVIRKHVKAGDAAIDLQTGAHIHVDFHKSGFNHVRNLVVLHNFIEDPFYRLGAANYNRHRGTHYAIVLPKSGIDSQEEFNRYFFRRGSFDTMHHSVLNVDGYYKAAANCSCGHLVGETPENCECQLGKCTVEFRVFNGTSSWRKLHAYTALCQSLVAYARAHDDLAVADFPPVLYNPVGVIDDNLKRAWIERLTWMFKNLWFSDEERESINYCIEHSDIASLSYSQRKALRDIGYVGVKYVNAKSPRKPAKSPYEISGRPGHRGDAEPAQSLLAQSQAAMPRPAFSEFILSNVQAAENNPFR